MLYKTLCPISHLGDRIERGAELELTDEQALNYASDVEIVSDQPAVEEAPAVEVAVEEMSGKQLKEKAASLGLKATGSNADLIERITLHLASAPAVEVAVEAEVVD